jgi:hypothetical protein
MRPRPRYSPTWPRPSKKRMSPVEVRLRDPPTLAVERVRAVREVDPHLPVGPADEPEQSNPVCRRLPAVPVRDADFVDREPGRELALRRGRNLGDRVRARSTLRGCGVRRDDSGRRQSGDETEQGHAAAESRWHRGGGTVRARALRRCARQTWSVRDSPQDSREPGYVYPSTGPKGQRLDELEQRVLLGADPVELARARAAASSASRRASSGPRRWRSRLRRGCRRRSGRARRPPHRTRPGDALVRTRLPHRARCEPQRRRAPRLQPVSSRRSRRRP